MDQHQRGRHEHDEHQREGLQAPRVSPVTGFVFHAGDHTRIRQPSPSGYRPIDRSFAYLLPLGPDETLLESATFRRAAEETDAAPLLRYLETRSPKTNFVTIHAESGSIPLGFPPPQTAGPRHILLGTKRGLVKPSAGCGIVSIAKESEELARLWREGLPLPQRPRKSQPRKFLDTGFLRLVENEPRLTLELLGKVMRDVPLVGSLGFMAEQLPAGRLASIFFSGLPIVFRSVAIK